MVGYGRLPSTWIVSRARGSSPEHVDCLPSTWIVQGRYNDSQRSPQRLTVACIDVGKIEGYKETLTAQASVGCAEALCCQLINFLL